MAFVATKKTAVVAGVASGLCAIGVEAWLKHYPPDGSLEQQFLIFGVTLVFGLVPAFACVLGLVDPKAPVRALPRIMLHWLIWILTASFVAGVGIAIVA